MNRILAQSAFLTLAVLIVLIGGSTVSAQKLSKNSSPNSPSTTPLLVLSQVDGGGGGSTGTYLNDYVEIKNIASFAQSLNGLSLMYGSATGQFGSSSSNVFALPDVTLQPGQYYLVQLGAAGTAGAALPVTPDATTTNLSMSATSGKVVLVITSGFPANTCGATATPCTLPNGNIVDLVSWGASNNAEGGAPTNGGLALTSSQGNVRKDGGCTDTNNNNLDFTIVTAPVPRNSASPATQCGVTSVHTSLDFDGDGKSDYSLVRDNNGLLEWWISLSSGGVFATQFGLSSDHPTPADYDGDGKTDLAVWRDGAPGQAAFYILQSASNTLRIDVFGQSGDDPKVVRDYDGDGMADPAVYRPGATSNDQSFFFYRGSMNNPGFNVTYVPWGVGGDIETTGDFDGDGKGDFVIRRNSGGQGVFYLLKSSGGVEFVYWGLSSDGIVPCDFDGDSKSDFCVARLDASNNFNIYVLTRTGGGTGASPIIFGSVTTNDKAAFGDYDGDGKTDIGIWRPGATPSFWIRSTASGNTTARQWGASTDRSLAEWNLTGGI